MKKIFVLLMVAFVTLTISAQDAKTSMINFGKSQYSGYLLNVKGASVDLVDATIRDMFETQYNLKASKEGGFRAYLNQAFAPFGSENFDIYYNVSEFGKKKDKTTLVSMIVCTGNMNAITSANNPDVDNAIRYFLKNIPSKVEQYSKQQEINTLKEQLAKLQSTKESLVKNQDKTQKQIDKLKQTMEKGEEKIKETEKAIVKAQEQLKALQK